MEFGCDSQCINARYFSQKYGIPVGGVELCPFCRLSQSVKTLVRPLRGLLLVKPDGGESGKGVRTGTEERGVSDAFGWQHMTGKSMNSLGQQRDTKQDQPRERDWEPGDRPVDSHPCCPSLSPQYTGQFLLLPSALSPIGPGSVGSCHDNCVLLPPSYLCQNGKRRGVTGREGGAEEGQ